MLSGRRQSKDHHILGDSQTYSTLGRWDPSREEEIFRGELLKCSKI